MNTPNEQTTERGIADMLNRLHQADALQFARRLPTNSIDMLLTDPPYSSGGLHASTRAQSTSKKYISSDTKQAYEDFESDNMDQRSWTFWCHAWLSEAKRALKPGGLIVCFVDWRQLPALTDVIQAAGFIQRGIAVWDKTPHRARPRRGGFKQQAEFIVWASKGSMRARDVYLPGVFPCPLALPKKHLTEKPFELAREIVRLAPEGGTVCDLFAGSGTFLIAAKEAGLDWIVCETNAVYYGNATARLLATRS
jgi:site-specific DNA-methyltransferase (adenine-specific)